MAVRDFLVFRLTGMLAAWGEVAVGERRGVWDAPSKSAVLGLLAGALGHCRNDADAHALLDRGLGFAVRLDDQRFDGSGQLIHDRWTARPLRDYHTAQAPAEAARTRRRKAGFALSTRRADLDAGGLNTVLSERIYRVDAAATVLFWLKSDRALPLAEFAEAIRRPCFTPYLGRKACPLGRPPRPCVIAADGLVAALDRYDAAERAADIQLRRWFAMPESDYGTAVWFELEAGLDDEDGKAELRRRRRDGVRDRGAWHFNDRAEGRLIHRARVLGEGVA